MKIILLLFMWLMFATTAAHGQRNLVKLVDSLLTELPKAKEDTNKLMLLKYIAANMTGIDPRKALPYSEMGITLAQKLNHPKHLADHMLNKGTTYLRLGVNDSAVLFLKKQYHSMNQQVLKI